MKKQTSAFAIVRLVGAVFLLVSLLLVARVVPALEPHAITKKIAAWRSSDVAPAASLIESEKAGINTRQIAAVEVDNVAPNQPNTEFNCNWSVGPVTPVALLDSPVTSVGGNIYLFGGVQGGAITAASFKFDGTTWTAIAPLPAALEFAAAVTDGTDCYILGGALTGTGTPQTTLFRYNVALNTYTTLAPFTTGTWNHAAVYLNGKIYKFCGTGPATNSTNALEIYTISTNTWAAGAAYPITESFVSGWTQGGFIYGAGGIDGATSVATAKTFRYDPVANSWDDVAIADLPATRWGAATAIYDTDVVLAGGYVNGVATANISPTVLSWNTSTSWQPVPDMAGAPSGTHERSRFTAAVLGGSFYAVGGRSLASSSFAGTNSNQKLTCLNTPTNIITSGGSMIISAGGNGALDPGETVTVSLGAQNSGGPGVVCTTAATTGTLQASGGVTSPSAPQNYGALCSPPSPTSRNFTFTVDPSLPCGSTVTATLQIQDGATNYGNLTYTFVTGTLAASYTENFDAVVAPALPAGWTTASSGAGMPVVTSTTFPDTAPNDIFFFETTVVALEEAVTPVIALPPGTSKLTFRNLFNTESTFDGEVLEISIAGGAFQDILTAGGTFVSGGYNSTLSTGFDNPLPGRMAWSGLSGGTATAPTYITTVVNLPAAAGGQNVKLKWRQGSDASVAPTTNPGSRVDTILINSPVCDAASPLVSAESRLNHGGVDYDIPLPLLPMGVTAGAGIECRRGSGAGLDTYTIVADFSSPTAPGAISGLTVDCGSVSAPVQGANPNQLLFQVSGACYNATSLPQYSAIHFTVAGTPVWITWGHCIGDTTGDTAVNSGDVGQTKASSGQTLSTLNFRRDLNADGTLNSGDVSLVKSKSGTALP